MTKTLLKQINLVNLAFLVLSPIVAFGGLTLLFRWGGPHPATWIFFFIYIALSAFGITAGYHRLFAHRSYEASPALKMALLSLGAACIEHSAKKWSADHRRHHEYVDRDLDPYNIKRGFWWAHIGWVFFKESEVDPELKNVPDLKKDPYVEFQHRHYLAIAILFGFLVPTAVASLWGDALGGLILVGFVRVVVNHHFTFFVNSLAHLIGNQPYSKKDSSRDNWIVALLTYGEGYHNFHHTFQGDYRNGVEPWHWDPTKWFIHGMSRMGLACNLRTTPDSKILRAKLSVQEQHVMERQSLMGESHRTRFEEALASAKKRVEDSLKRWEELRFEYQQAKTETQAAAREKLADLKREIAASRLEFKQNLEAWKALIQGSLA